MLFQGEEWATSSPFAFFTSHPEEELGRAVSEGRLKEFERMDWDPSTVPDPQDPQTFASSKLSWDDQEVGRHAVVLKAYRDLAELRRRVEDLTDPDLRRTPCTVDEDARWFLMRRGDAVVVANFGDREVVVEVGDDRRWEVPWQSPAGVTVRGREVVLPPHAGCMLR